MPIRRYKVTGPVFHHSLPEELDAGFLNLHGLGQTARELVMFANATPTGFSNLSSYDENFRALRILRDPRQILVSNYFHHRDGHAVETAGWIWDKLQEDKVALLNLPEEEGIRYELENITGQMLTNQIFAPFSDSRILTVRFEDLLARPTKTFRKIFRWLGLSDVDLSSIPAPLGSSRPWQDYLSEKNLSIFMERYGDATAALGYPSKS